jgi:hypothetical protein
MILEYSQFLSLIANYLPYQLSNEQDFINYLLNPSLASLNDYAD